MKKVILFILLLIPSTVLAVADNATSSVLIDYETGTILYESEKDKELPPASMTKMMSLLIVMEYLDSGKISLQDKVYISKAAASMGGSQAYLEENTYMDLESLLKSVAIASANDSIYALSEHISGSVSEFVKKMNEKAKKLGLKHTHFVNPHGLDAKKHYSSAYDMALIARELVKHDKILKYSSIYEDYIKHQNGSSTWIVNTNKLINYYKGLDGLKTGYTKTSGYCLTATAKRGNMRLISVVMGEETNQIRNEDTVELLNYGFANFKIVKPVDNTYDLGKIDIKFGEDEKAKLKLKKDAVDLINISEDNNYTYKIDKYDVIAPVKKGDKVGELTLYANNNEVDKFPLTVDKDIKRASFIKLYLRNLKYLISGSY